MDTYQRPITPPTDHSKEQVHGTTIPTANGGITTIPSAYGEKDSLSDPSHLQRQQENVHHNNRSSMSSLDTNSHSATNARLTGGSFDSNSSATHLNTNARLSAGSLNSNPTTNTRSLDSNSLDQSYNSTTSPTYKSGSTGMNPTYNSGSTGLHSGSTGMNSGSTGLHSGSTGLNSGSTGLHSGSTGLHSGSTGLHTGSTAPSSTYNRNSGSTGYSAPSAPPTSTSASNPFNDSHSSSIPSTRKYDQDNLSPNKKSFNSAFNEEGSQKHRSYGGRNETTHRMETEVLSVLQWRNPLRSGVLFALIVGSIVLTRWYSLLQIGSTCLTLAIGINLIYVNLILQSQKVLTNHEATHPYSDVIDNDRTSMIDRGSVNHYATVMTELSETVVRALTRIIFIEDTVTSVKWMSIFFAIWKISAHFSTMDIILMVVISAFTFPRLYISNKEVVDAQFQKGQTLLQSGIHKAQTAATENAQNTYVKAKAYVAQVGTTGTDAKNTMTHHSVTLKDDQTL
ncbi:hypothetical protein INT47_009270 [Mucor saturninus]|uniref:Reticulon-like protein n=1 Tax=Mucor saturninus TaxID=64648 RepID=A0A8H7V3F0_9FUNG|nr:hypothetical protein INT47_009270 [Mucor saturninus]